MRRGHCRKAALAWLGALLTAAGCCLALMLRGKGEWCHCSARRPGPTTQRTTRSAIRLVVDSELGAIQVGNRAHNYAPGRFARPARLTSQAETACRRPREPRPAHHKTTKAGGPGRRCTPTIRACVPRAMPRRPNTQPFGTALPASQRCPAARAAPGRATAGPPTPTARLCGARVACHCSLRPGDS